jgi:hypothetical protein
MTAIMYNKRRNIEKEDVINKKFFGKKGESLLSKGCRR